MKSRLNLQHLAGGNTPPDNNNRVAFYQRPNLEAWHFIPFAELSTPPPHGQDLIEWAATSPVIDYFWWTMGFVPIENFTVENVLITADRPTLWRFDVTVKGSETRHIEIEHADLMPMKITELCS